MISNIDRVDLKNIVDRFSGRVNKFSFVIRGNLKFLVQPDRLKQGCTNEIQENYDGRKRRDFSAAL
jgi:hypothetical protein